MDRERVAGDLCCWDERKERREEGDVDVDVEVRVRAGRPGEPVSALVAVTATAAAAPAGLGESERDLRDRDRECDRRRDDRLLSGISALLPAMSVCVLGDDGDDFVADDAADDARTFLYVALVGSFAAAAAAAALSLSLAQLVTVDGEEDQVSPEYPYPRAGLSRPCMQGERDPALPPPLACDSLDA